VASFPFGFPAADFIPVRVFYLGIFHYSFYHSSYQAMMINVLPFDKKIKLLPRADFSFKGSGKIKILCAEYLHYLHLEFPFF
jgi:hypothetical protein